MQFKVAPSRTTDRADFTVAVGAGPKPDNSAPIVVIRAVERGFAAIGTTPGRLISLLCCYRRNLRIVNHAPGSSLLSTHPKHTLAQLELASDRESAQAKCVAGPN